MAVSRSEVRAQTLSATRVCVEGPYAIATDDPRLKVKWNEVTPRIRARAEKKARVVFRAWRPDGN